MVVSKQDLRLLAEGSSEHCVSIYMPTDRIGIDIQHDRIRFKNLLKSVEQRLLATGKRQPDVNHFVSPAVSLMEDTRFWRNQSEALAVFIGEGFVRHYLLPMPTKEIAVVSDRFHLKPLLPLLDSGEQFYVLAVSLNAARLFKAGLYDVVEVEVSGMPEGAMSLSGDPKEGFVAAVSTRTPTKSGRSASVFYGHATGSEDEKAVAEPYLREVLRATRPLTGKSPVVFAGVEYLHSIAAAMASGMRLTPRFISGNPDVMTASQLHAHAVEIMKPHYEEAVNADLERFNHVAGTGKTSTEPSEVAMRAYHGMVDTLFVDGTIEIWGKIDPDVQEVQIHDQHEAKDQDILDFAAVHTVLNGGTVHVLERSRMSEGRPLAALFRY